MTTAMPQGIAARGVPEIRLRALNDAPVRPERDYVLYWMTAYRRTRFNFSMERAATWASQLGKQLIVLESLRVDYPWASDRLHRFIIDGMADNRDEIGETAAAYYPYVERAPGEGRGLIAALAAQACVVVTDDFPAFFLPRAAAAAAARIDVLLEAVDSNGIHALRSPGQEFTTAYAFRRWLQRNIHDDLAAFPLADPLAGIPEIEGGVPAEIARRWPMANVDADGIDAMIAALPIDHSVAAVERAGGSRAGRAHFDDFIDRLSRYDDERNHPDDDGGSGMSPYLHFGHVSPHEMFLALAEAEGWSMSDVSSRRDGGRTGFWGMSTPAEAFVDQLVTWRELGFNLCVNRGDYDEYASLPSWARKTLADHAGDPRPDLYTSEQLEAAATQDLLWNAAQTQLLRDGRIHNYLRMLWGKKILEWSATPQEALARMIHLNNKYALDGRDPNSYSGIFWVLGRYDRAWGPRRPIYGTVRYMSSANTARKLRVQAYLERYAPRSGEEMPS